MLKSYIAFDIETTGLSPEENEIIEIGALKVRDGKVQERFMEFIKPRLPIPANITGITGITNDMVEDARGREQVIPDFLQFCGQDILIGHNVLFDYSFVKRSAESLGYTFERDGIDTLKIARTVHRDLPPKVWENCVSITGSIMRRPTELIMTRWLLPNCIRRWHIILKRRNRRSFSRALWSAPQRNARLPRKSSWIFSCVW